MNCQMMNCEAEATVWTRYDSSNDYAMCQDCAEFSKRYAENPDLCQHLPLTVDVEELLSKMQTISGQEVWEARG